MGLFSFSEGSSFSGRGGNGCGGSDGLSLGSLMGDGGGFGSFGGMGGCGDNGFGIMDNFGHGMQNMLSGFEVGDFGLGNSSLGRTLGIIGGALLQGALNRFAYGDMQDLCGSCRHLDQRFDPYGGGRFDNYGGGQCQSDYTANMPHGFRNNVQRLAMNRIMRGGMI